MGVKPAVPLVLRGQGSRTFIAFAAGRKWLKAVAMREPIKLVSLPIEHGLQPLLLKGKPYPVRRAARAYLRSEVDKTKRARQVLRQLVKNNAGSVADAGDTHAGNGQADQAAPGLRSPLHTTTGEGK